MMEMVLGYIVDGLWKHERVQGNVNPSDPTEGKMSVRLAENKCKQLVGCIPSKWGGRDSESLR